MLLPQIIDEIKGLKNEPTRRSSLSIDRMLESHKTLLLQKLEADNYNMASKSFHSLAQASAAEYNSRGYKDDYERAHSLLMFYLNRAI